MAGTPSSPDDKGVITRCSGGVATISLNNPSRMNALTADLADHLVRAIDAVDADPSIGALVIKGEGGTFCSGAHLSTLGSAMEDPAGEIAYGALDRVYRAFTRLGEARVLTIAAVRGAAVGAGLNLALAADLRIVAHDARLLSGFATLGLHPGGGHFQLLVRATNHETATAMAVLSQEISGRRAVELGLAWESLDDESVEDRAASLAGEAASDPELTRQSIQSLRLTTAPTIPWGVALQAERSPQLWSFRRAAARRTDV